MSDPKVQVLLSTYNGEKYIAAQLDSLLVQTEAALHVLIRDDGSSDSTVSILKEYATKHPQCLQIKQGINVGAKVSFFKLLEQAPENADFYAFCDQDDVWKPEKLGRAIKLLNQESQDIPLLYCSSTQMVDHNLSMIGVWPQPPRKPLTMFNALVENVAVGCTMVMNKAAMTLVKAHLPQNFTNIIMHDWWVYLTVSSFGKVVFDDLPHIFYRQHTANVQGGQTDSWIGKWRRRIKRFNAGNLNHKFSKQALEFFDCYSSLLDPHSREAVELFLEYSTKPLVFRILYSTRCPFYRQSTLDNWVLKFIFAARKI